MAIGEDLPCGESLYLFARHPQPQIERCSGIPLSTVLRFKLKILLNSWSHHITIISLQIRELYVNTDRGFI